MFIAAMVIEDALNTSLGALSVNPRQLRVRTCLREGGGTYLHFGSRVSQPRRHSRHLLHAGRLWIRESRSMSPGLLETVDMASHGMPKARRTSSVVTARVEDVEDVEDGRCRG
jgi:hypothetical protein